MTTRRHLTPKEKEAMLTAQDFLCGCGCGQPITMQTGEAEHYVPVALGNDGKPDAIWHPDCHLAKSKNDVRNIAKAKRIAKRNGLLMPRPRRGRPIPTRRFAKAPDGYKHFWKPEKRP